MQCPSSNLLFISLSEVFIDVFLESFYNTCVHSSQFINCQAI